MGLHESRFRVVGLLHPGAMGATLGGQLRAAGVEVLWAGEGRGPGTARRAEAAGLEDAGTLAELVERSDLVLSVCPPHAAVTLAREVLAADGDRAYDGRSGSTSERCRPFAGVYVDANAVSPRTVAEVGSMVGDAGAAFVDGGIVGPPPHHDGTTRLYLAGSRATEVASLFEPTNLDARVVEGAPGAASALKMAYAAWTKGTAALLLGAHALASAAGVHEALVQEWALSQPDLAGRTAAATSDATAKGWRWAGEMEEIAAAFADVGLPSGFHRAAAEVYRRAEGAGTADDEVAGADLDALVTALLGRPGPQAR